MKTDILVVLAENPQETFCHDCGQLRLYLKSGQPKSCGNCKSENIEVDEVGSKRLEALRGRQ